MPDYLRTFYRGFNSAFVGNCRIRGVVTVSSQPAKRRVACLRRSDLIVAAQTYSDPVTGEYEFSQISNDYVYTVIATDHENNYNAVVADIIVPEPMP